MLSGAQACPQGTKPFLLTVLVLPAWEMELEWDLLVWSRAQAAGRLPWHLASPDRDFAASRPPHVVLPLTATEPGTSNTTGGR